MKAYQVTVNGQVFQVTVEDASGTGTIPAMSLIQPVAAPQPAPMPQPVAPAPKPAPAPAPAKPKAEVPAGGKKVQAPMPGKILKLNFTTGSTVKRGDVLMVLEAMKMENDIMAPNDATIVSVHVAQGDNVNTGDLLVVLG